MKINQRMIDVLRKKIRWNHDFSELCGYLQYREIVILVDHLKISIPESQETWVTWSRDHLKKGENSGTWFYFHPREDLLPSKKQHDPSTRA